MKLWFNLMVFFVFISGVNAFDEFDRGVGITESNKMVLWNTSLPYAISRQGLREYDSESIVVGFYDNYDSVYTLTSDIELLFVESDSRQVYFDYQVERWLELSTPQVINTTSRNGDLKSAVNYSKYYPSLGCYNNSPLRIGDIEEDGASEVVLFLNDEMIVFSPEYQRIVFAMFTDISDYFPHGEQALLEETYLKDFNEPPPDDVLFHDMALSWVDSAFEGQFEPAIRVYTKVYNGDFDDDGNPDLVTWQKIYKAEPKTSAVAYTRLDNLLTHYERDLEAQAASDTGVAGEYLPQITEQSVVSQWFTDADLTWQKGFPSHSECEGQEGQLIPEMHDRLLNDPDVLQ